MTAVHYRGEAPLLQDMLGGRVSLRLPFHDRLGRAYPQRPAAAAGHPRPQRHPQPAGGADLRLARLSRVFRQFRLHRPVRAGAHAGADPGRAGGGLPPDHGAPRRAAPPGGDRHHRAVPAARRLPRRCRGLPDVSGRGWWTGWGSPRRGDRATAHDPWSRRIPLRSACPRHDPSFPRAAAAERPHGRITRCAAAPSWASPPRRLPSPSSPKSPRSGPRRATPTARPLHRPLPARRRHRCLGPHGGRGHAGRARPAGPDREPRRRPAGWWGPRPRPRRCRTAIRCSTTSPPMCRRR